MRRLLHIPMSPACRLTRLVIGEKRLAVDLTNATDPMVQLPVFTDMDGAVITGLWAIIDHLESNHPEYPLLSEAATERAEAMRLVDWAMTLFHETVTKRIVFEKAAQSHTGAMWRRAPDMATVRQGREALREALKWIGPQAEANGYLACRDVTLGDLAVVAHLSALDYFDEVPWQEFPQTTEWYARIKSRPCFRPLLSDRLPGQPPALNYADIDF